MHAISIPELPCAAEPYLPHDAPMALIDEIVSVSEGSLEAVVAIHPACQFAAQDGVPVWVGVEYMAQGIAAFGAVLARSRGEPVKIGFLVSARRVSCAVDSFNFGDRLRVVVQEVHMPDDGLATFDCRIVQDGDELMTARINVYQPADPIKYLEQGL